eukprot:Colp12_sorted_trinity150504_noHs@27034
MLVNINVDHAATPAPHHREVDECRKDHMGVAYFDTPHTPKKRRLSLQVDVHVPKVAPRRLSYTEDEISDARRRLKDRLNRAWELDSPRSSDSSAATTPRGFYS